MTRNAPATPPLAHTLDVTEPSPARRYSHYEVAYIKLRTSMAVLSFALPVGLLIISYVIPATGLQDSMSAYYRPAAGEFARNFLVAMLSAIGLFLWMYEGYSRVENRVLDVAGVLLIGVAFCNLDLKSFPAFGLNIPVAWPLPAWVPGKEITVHGICATGFFGCMIYVTTVLSGQTLRDRDDAVQCKWLLRYWLVSAVMVLTMGGALVMHQLAHPLFHDKLVFWVESAGVVAFAVFWLMKTREVNPTMPWGRTLLPLKPASVETAHPGLRLHKLGLPEAPPVPTPTSATAGTIGQDRRVSALCAFFQWIERRFSPAPGSHAPEAHRTAQWPARGPGQGLPGTPPAAEGTQPP